MAKYSYDDLTYEYLHSILTYDSETGKLYHKPRPRDMFKSDRVWKIWNTRYANQKAGTEYESTKGYWVVQLDIFGKKRKAHRVIWFMQYGEWPKDQIDHINGDSTDNRIENLRDVTHKENSLNRKLPCNNTSGTLGVSFDKKCKKWESYIMVNYTKISLGFFTHKEDAIAARKEAEIKYGFHENHGRETVNAEG